MTGLTPRERLSRALEGAPVDWVPVWMMRQAGRSLPEYRKLREEHSFAEVCSDPALAREVTLQPVDRFGMDAAVVFSDILLPLERLGFTVRYGTGHGPVVEDPLREPEQVDEIPDPEPSGEPPDQAKTVRAVRESRPELGIVGFAGAPFTLACYLIEGGSPRRYEHVNRFRYTHPEAFARLLARLSSVVGDQLDAQAKAGADAVQLFDTHAEILSPEAYAQTPQEATQAAFDAVDHDAASILFARGSAHLLGPLTTLDVDALSVDWRVDLAEVADLAEGFSLQGNLDPGVLQAPPKRAREEAQAVLEAGAAARGHVFNLGHGVTPNARVASIQAVVDTVKREGKR